MLAEAGARPADGAAADEFYLRTTADPSLDVHRIEGGDTRTIVPPVVHCDLSVRLVAGQDPPAIAAALESLLRGALPDGAELSSRPGRRRRRASTPSRTALQIARGALARSCGREPVLLRTGGTLPILASFAERGIPVDRLRLRAPAGQPPRAGRVLRAREPRARAPRRAGALRGPQRAASSTTLTSSSVVRGLTIASRATVSPATVVGVTNAVPDVRSSSAQRS